MQLRTARLTKKAFIATLPDDMPTAEVVRLAKAQRIELKRDQVSRLRWVIRQDRKAGKSNGHANSPFVKPVHVKARQPSVPPPPGFLATRKGTNGHDVERKAVELRLLALQLGLERTHAIVVELDSILAEVTAE